jgi:predicted Rdx family selenoprotein
MKRIGGQPPRYSFILNPYSDVRVSKCPQCNRPTYARKFALFIHVDGFGPIVLGKTCRYCSRCELIVPHQDELEAQLAHGPAGLKPGSGGYLVIGTMNKKVWEKGLHGEGEVAATLQQVADFKKVLTLHVDPGGWRPA